MFGPTGQRTHDKKELWEIIKNDNEIYDRLVADTGVAESEIEERIFKLFPNVPSVDEVMEVSGDSVSGEPKIIQIRKGQAASTKVLVGQLSLKDLWRKSSKSLENSIRKKI